MVTAPFFKTYYIIASFVVNYNVFPENKDLMQVVNFTVQNDRIVRLNFHIYEEHPMQILDRCDRIYVSNSLYFREVENNGKR